NTAKHTLRCIASVFEKTQKNILFQVIVADNNSSPSDYEHLRANFPKHKNCSLHRSNINTGFGGGNMFAAQFACARYLLFLNNDALLLNNAISIMINHMQGSPGVGVATAQQYDGNNRSVKSFDHNKGPLRLLFGRRFLERTNPARYPKRNKQYTHPTTVDWVNGAFLFFSARAFAAIGGFDSNIFLYWEEMDVCHRLRQMGYAAQLVPAAKIMHHQGASTPKTRAVARESYISYLYVTHKNFGVYTYCAIKAHLTIALLLKPKKWYLLPTVLRPNPQTASLKHKQKMVFYES
ncbi:MAG: glycosyltransferase, partial [Marinirhabdus sp.]